MIKNFTILASAFLLGFTVNAQEIVAEAQMGPGYANDVYFGLADQTVNTVARDWDIAFYRRSAFSMGVRVNDEKISGVYEVADNFSAWDNVAVDGLDSLEPLYNSDTDWEDGAFNQGSATYGWGNYNFASHVVEGKVIFVLKYANGDYVKFRINNLTTGTYNFTYAKYVNGAWGEDKTVSIAKDSSTDRIFNYFNITTESVVTPEPETSQWDLKFTRYISDYDPTTKYPYTGVLQSDNVKVAEIEGDGVPTAVSEFKSEINTVGHDWKVLSGFSYILRDVSYFIKNSTTNKIYKLEFTEAPSTSVGKVSFKYTDVTSDLVLGLTDFSNVNFDVYTEAGRSKAINVVLNSKESFSSDVQVEIYSMNGQLVHQEKYRPSSSFSTKNINLSKLAAGIYIVKVQSDSLMKTKKVVIK